MFHNIHAKITCQHAYLITTDIKKIPHLQSIANAEFCIPTG